MIKRHLPRVKTFKIVDNVDEEVNAFVIQIFEITGNTPAILPCCNHIMVTWTELVEVNYSVPKRQFANINTSKDV